MEKYNVHNLKLLGSVVIMKKIDNYLEETIDNIRKAREITK